MKINKLIGLEKTLELIQMGIPAETLLKRHTGRSTAKAFHYINLAITYPGSWIDIIDHHGTSMSDRCLLNDIRDIIDKLDFKCFNFKISYPQIQFELFEEYEKQTIWRLKDKMKTFKHMITEASYPGNVGFVEMAKFYQTADKKQIKQMEDIIKAEDWDGFKKLIQKVLDVKLK